MGKRVPRYDQATLEDVTLAHLFETKALLNVLERKGLVTLGEVSAEIRRLKDQAASRRAAENIVPLRLARPRRNIRQAPREKS